MRIIGGTFKGRIIEMPKDIRPTSDKVREALFEILKSAIEESIFMDLYCGSGAVGIEALSRGAKRVIFVDNNIRSILALKRNIKIFNIAQYSIDIYTKEVIKFLKAFEKQALEPDIIFLDPPYYRDIAKNTLLELSKCDILTKHALVIVEAFKKDILSERIGNLEKFRSCKYGDTKLEFYRKVESRE